MSMPSGLVLPSPPRPDLILEPMDPRYVTAASAIAGISTAYLIKFRVQKPTIATALSIYVGAASGNVDLGIFSSTDGVAFTLLGSTGSTLSAGTNAAQTINLPVNVLLAPGTNYWAALAADNTTLTVGQIANASGVAAINKTALTKAALFPLAGFSTASASGRAPYLAITTTG